MIATALRPSKAGSYFKLFALEMKTIQAVLVVTLLILGCLEPREKRYLKIVTLPSQYKFCSGFDRTVNGKPDEGGLKKRGPELDQLK